jgi:hypothetical protein
MTDHPRCHIGRVRYKSAANLTVLRPPRPLGIGIKLAEMAREMACDIDWREMAGWVIVAWTDDGRGGANIYQPKGPVPNMLIPHFCEEVLRNVLYAGD